MLADALSDLRGEVLAGKTAADVVDSVAADYSLNPKLVMRKFLESYGSEDALRATAAATKPKAKADELQDKIAKACARYRVPNDEGVKLVTFEGKRYSAVCRSGSKVIGVSHDDLGVWQLPIAGVKLI